MAEPIAYEGFGFRLEASPAGHVLQALSRSLGADLSARLQTIAELAPFAVRRAGPEAWFVVGAARLRAVDVARRGAAIADVAWLVDQTEGRSRIAVSGPQSARRLARGIGADLAQRRFVVGGAMETQYAGIGLHLARTAAESFEILVGRSFVECLWNELAA